MPVTYYSIVRYLPDDIRGEQLNVGVIALTEDGTFAGSRFDPSLQRARSLARGADVGFIRALRDTFHDILTTQLGSQLPLVTNVRGREQTLEGKPRLDVSLLRHLARQWANSIQLSEPRASLEPDPQRLLDEIFRRYVVPTATAEHKRPHDRRWLVSRAAEVLQALAYERFTDASQDIVRRKYVLDGFVERHTFELALTRNDAVHAVCALSFESDDQRSVSREIESVAWSIDDTRKATPRLPISVLAVDVNHSPAFDRAEHICNGLNATFVPSSRIEDWANGAMTVAALG